MKRGIQNKIIKKLSFSDSLRRAIEERKYIFSERDLFLCVVKYCKYYDTRKELLSLLANAVEDNKGRRKIRQYIEYERLNLESLGKTEENMVFIVKPYGFGSRERDIVTPTFEDALNAARLFHKYYATYETPQDRAKEDVIQKVPVVCPQKPRDINKAKEKAFCAVDNKGKITTIDYYKNNLNSVNATETENLPRFPSFLRQGDLVSIHDKWEAYYKDGEKTSEGIDGKKYGIIGADMTEENSADDVALVELLQSSWVRERRCEEKSEDGYYLCLMSHTHVDYPYLEKEDPANAPDEIRADYEYYLEFLNKNGFKKEKEI